MSDRLDGPTIDLASSASQATITVVLDSSLPSTTGGEDRTNSLGVGVIAINPSHLDNLDLVQHLFGYELGHALGFGTSGCDATASKMTVAVSTSGPFTGGAITCADKAAVDRDYRRDESPILVDLDGDGIHLSAPADGAHFDLTGFGLPQQFSWPSQGDAFLALDLNQNGRIDDGSELFGNWTRLKSGDLASHGFEALAELDQDQNLQIDASDPIFPSLLLWEDMNRNGVSEPAELRSLQDAGFRGLSTDAKRSDRRDQWGNRFQYRATVFGSAPVLHRFAYDVFLAKADSRVH